MFKRHNHFALPNALLRRLLDFWAVQDKAEIVARTTKSRVGTPKSQTIFFFFSKMHPYPFSKHRTKYGGIWFKLQTKSSTLKISINRSAIAQSEQSLKKLIDRCHIPPYLFLSREDDVDDVRDIGKHDFRSVLCHSLLSNANRFDAYEKTTKLQICASYRCKEAICWD